MWHTVAQLLMHLIASSNLLLKQLSVTTFGKLFGQNFFCQQTYELVLALTGVTGTSANPKRWIKLCSTWCQVWWVSRWAKYCSHSTTVKWMLVVTRHKHLYKKRRWLTLKKIIHHQMQSHVLLAFLKNAIKWSKKHYGKCCMTLQYKKEKDSYIRLHLKKKLDEA